jgi:acetylornithine/succinyldiaminopimelate/putrescine aminotransferase
MGRTGSWFAWQGTGVKPDAFSLAKAIAGGIPMGAIVSNAKLADVFTPGKHASTFGGNPLACAAALAVLDTIEKEGLLARAKEAGEKLREGLAPLVEKFEQVLDVRGVGLMCGLVLDGPAKEVVDRCREFGLLACVAGGNVVRLVPPLTVKDAEIEEAVEMLGDALDEIYGDGEEE